MTGKLLSSVAFVSIMFTAGTAESSVAPQALTLERLKAQSVSFLEDSSNADIAVHELKTTAAAGDVSVRIDGKTYYFTPVYAENASALQTLADIGSVALKKLTDSTGAIYSLKIDGETVYYGYDKDAFPTSGYSLSEISKDEAENASFPVVKRYTKNSNNTLTETYYKVNIPDIGSGNNTIYYKWEKDDKGLLTLVATTDASTADITVKYGEDGENERQDSLSGDVDADFIGSKIEASSKAYGGAIYNNGTIGNITSDFINNYAQGTYALGGAIYNWNGTIGDIIGDFIGNYAQGSWADGGAIYNYGTIGNITGDFIGNYAKSSSSEAYGGAIYNSSKIGNITGDFIGNYAQASSWAYGGAIYNYNYSTIGNITGDFIGNYAQASSSSARGGAICNDYNSTIGNITGDFIGNYAQSSSSSAAGGAIFNVGGTISNIINSSFTDNYAQSASGTAQGGAIWSNRDILITADNGTSLFDGNYVSNDGGISKKYEAVYMNGANLNLSAVNKGTITFNDGIDGVNYNVNVKGDGTGAVKFNNLVENVNNFNLSSGSITHLGLNGVINVQNMTAETGSTLVGRQSTSASPIITVDVEVDKAANKVNSGAINVAEDVSGDYRVLVNALNPDVLDNKDDAIVPFLFAENDKEDTASSFSVARVIGSPYMWDGAVNAKGEAVGSTWYLNLTDILNPDYKPEEPENPDNDKPSKPVVRPVAPEVIAGMGLHEAAIEQTRSLVRNVRNKVAAGREYCPNCGVYSAEWDGEKLRNGWVLAQGETATIDKPVKMDADIWGVEAGFDVQNDVNNTLGVFASYRKGEYDLNGKADKLRSTIGSEIDIDSYLAGLYYRYDKNMNWLFATVYGGVQQADAKTDDKIAKFDTDGIEFGASVEAGHTFALSNDLTLDPSLGLYYTQVNFDDAKDNLGKEYDWKDVKHLEAELGAKLEKQIDYAKIYVKPSVIQTITSGDSVKITGLNKLSTYDDATLGRIELGGRYGFTDALSAYGWVNYTFSSDYDATAFGAGVSYSW